MKKKIIISLLVIAMLGTWGWTERKKLSAMLNETINNAGSGASVGSGAKRTGRHSSGSNSLGSENRAMELDGLEMNIYIPSQKKEPPPDEMPKRGSGIEKSIPKQPDSLSLISSKEIQREKAAEERSREASAKKTQTEIPRLKPTPKFMDMSNMSGPGQRISLGDGGAGEGNSMGRTHSAHKPGSGESRSILKDKPGGDQSPVVIRCESGCPLPPGAVPLKGPLPSNAKVIDYDCHDPNQKLPF